MDLIDRLSSLSKNISTQLEHIHTEEAAKTSLVLPFLNALGYNVFDPREVVPEFTADFGTKKGEKVDYAIMNNGTPGILIECKSPGAPLNPKQAAQLYRYFSVTDARIAILTNGVVYKFYSDLDDSNKMDQLPFLELNMLDLREDLVRELKSLTKDRFDIDHIISSATELRYTKAIKEIFQANMEDPGDDFVTFFIRAAEPEKRVTSSTREFYKPLIHKALKTFIRERVSGRLNAALEQEDLEVRPSSLMSTSEAFLGEEDPPKADDGIVTTPEEIEGYYIVKSIMREVIESSRIIMRDVKSYCGILLDDNNRQPICRLHFNGSQNYIGLFDHEKNEERVPLETLDDIYTHKARLQAMAEFYA